MAAKATAGRNSLAAEEARLACAAAAGDAAAFATLYERYERRVYNLAYRLCGSESDAAEAMQEAFVRVMQRLPELADRSLNFGAYLFATTRNACFDLVRKRTRTRPTDAIPESAAPLGSGAGGLGLDPGAPEEDPDRSQLLAAQQEEIREANMKLPGRQREALALRELEELSYDEIAAIMEMNSNSVAQLISRARIKLRDELRGTALASVLARSKDCERALPLIAKREDGQLDEGSPDAIWLDRHLEECDRCRVGREAMLEAGTSYRAWVPLAVAPWLLRETMAKAAEATGADWSAAIANARRSRPAPSTLPGMPGSYFGNGGHGSPPRPRAPGGAAIAAGVAALTIVVAGVVAAPAGENGERTPVGRSVAGVVAQSAAAESGEAVASLTAVALAPAGGPSAFAAQASSPPPEGAAPPAGTGGEGPASEGGEPPGTEAAFGAPDLAPTRTVGPAPAAAPEPPPTPGPATGSPVGPQPLGEMMVPGPLPTEEGSEGEAPEGEGQEEEPEETGDEEPLEEEPEGGDAGEEPPREEPPDCEEVRQCG
jgi:RNA polymerase sigma factor (sigma-70 family)